MMKKTGHKQAQDCLVSQLFLCNTGSMVRGDWQVTRCRWATCGCEGFFLLIYIYYIVMGSTTSEGLHFVTSLLV